jgi:hypothetical protein
LEAAFARLLPISYRLFEHINLLGRYAFSVPEAVTRGELRPLRNPAEVLEEVGFVWLAPPLHTQFAYAANTYDNTVSAYSIGADGSLKN